MIEGTVTVTFEKMLDGKYHSFIQFDEKPPQISAKFNEAIYDANAALNEFNSGFDEIDDEE